MAFDLSNSSENSGKKYDFLPDVYVKTNKVVSTKLEYNVASTFSPDKSDDILLTAEVDVGRDFYPKIYIRGNFKKDPLSGEITSIGTVFKIRNYFKALGLGDKLQADNEGKILGGENLSKSTVGKEITYLSYLSGRKEDGVTKKYSTWDMVGNEPESLAKQFQEDSQKGYPRAYVTRNDEISTTGVSHESTNRSF